MYHGSMPEGAKMQSHHSFKRDDVYIVVATIGIHNSCPHPIRCMGLAVVHILDFLEGPTAGLSHPVYYQVCGMNKSLAEIRGW